MRVQIGEVLNFLDRYARIELDALRVAFPDDLDVLLPNHQSVSDGALLVKAAASRAALRQIGSAALSGTAIAVSRQRSAERLEDWAAGVTGISAMLTAYGVALTDSTPFKLGAASMTLLGTLVGVVARYRKRALFAKDIAMVAKTLSDAHASAMLLIRDIDAYCDETVAEVYDDKLVITIEESDKLLRTVNQALLDVGVEAVRA
jgi:hypothetical protein